jgi:hypothetical protein
MISSTSLATAASVLAAGSTCLLKLRHRTARRARRYQDPGLHTAPGGRGSWYAELVWFDRDDVMRWHLNSIPWNQHKLPHVFHRCWPQTCEISRTLAHVDRCPCGARRYGVFGKWYERGSRWVSGSGS